MGAAVQLERDARGQVRRLQTNAWQSVIERDVDGLEVYESIKKCGAVGLSGYRYRLLR